MEIVPRNVKVGGALGFLGGVVCVICLVLFLEIEESALADMGVYMLVAVMFFALAGGFAKGGQWSWEVLLLMTFLTIAVVGGSVVFEAMDLYAGIMLVIIGALIVVSLSVPSSKTWANRMRF
ncbi:MAG: hypothetical protein LBB30_02440 [Candidatus Methanoplasma sp.]|jgi:hypothetical protein|nr:hypothetical protein [Candidatus Methanoplasma sp.]